MNIVYTLNDKFVPQVGAGIVSVCENNKEAKDINFYLVSSGITDNNKKELSKLVKNYKRNIDIIELGDISDYFDFEFDTNGWNPIVLARLLLDKILPSNISRIIYLDGDTIVRGSILDLWNTGMGGKTIGMSIEPTIDKKRIEILDLGMHPYCNAGVLLIDLKRFKEINAGKKIIEYYKKYDGKLFANDQDAINGAMKDEIFIISPKYNFYNIFTQYPYYFLKRIMKPKKYIDKSLFLEAKKNPCIIHYLGEERPWRRGNTHKYKNDYIKYLNMTIWSDTPLEDGWVLYFICWRVFNILTKPFPFVRYKIINSLIPAFMKFRKRQLNKK